MNNTIIHSIKKYTKEIAIEKVNKLIKQKNDNGSDLEFLGFVDDKWIGNTTKLILKCNKHNIIWNTTSYNNFTKPNTTGCIECKKEKSGASRKLTPLEALNKVVKIHKNDITKYDYSKILSTYKSYHDSVTITCPIHGDFEVKFSTLMLGSNRGICPKCNPGRTKVSNIELYCLEQLNIILHTNIIHQYIISKVYDSIINKYRRLEVDFYIPELKTIIEYDGLPHFEYLERYHKNYNYFSDRVNRDRCLEQYCKENNIRLLRISYKDNNRIPEIIKIFFEEGRDVTTKVEPKLLPIKYYG